MLNNAEFFASIREYAQIAIRGDKMPVNITEDELRECLHNSTSYDDGVANFTFSEFHELILLTVVCVKQDFEKVFMVVTKDSREYNAIVNKYKNIGEYRQILNRFVIDYNRHKYTIDHNFYNLLPVHVSCNELERLADAGSVFCTLDEFFYTVTHMHVLSKGVYFMLINNRPITVINHESDLFAETVQLTDKLRLKCMKDIAKSVIEDIAISKSNGIAEVRLRNELSTEALELIDGFIYNGKTIRVNGQLIFIDAASYPIYLF